MPHEESTFKNTRQLARLVLKTKTQHGGFRGSAVHVMQHLQRAIGVIDHESHDAVIAGVGCAIARTLLLSVNASTTRDKMPRLAFNEHADLLNAHYSAPFRANS